MSADRPDLPSFDGRDVHEHAAQAAAEAIRAINHITSWTGAGMTWPSDAYRVLSALATVAALLPQAFEQIARQVTVWHEQGHLGIDAGRDYAGRPGYAAAVVHDTLTAAVQRADALLTELAAAVQVLAWAHGTGQPPAPETGAEAAADAGVRGEPR
jgi:hypothetical protein